MPPYSDYFRHESLWGFGTAFLLVLVSILQFQRQKYSVSLIFLFTGTLILGFTYALLDPFLILWDEQYHALVAKNLSQNPVKPALYAQPVLPYSYTQWTQNHIWLHKQPLFLWQIALCIKLLGNSILAVRLPSVILHALWPICIYRIGKIALNQRTGFIAALLGALAFFPLELMAGRATTDHNDLSFLFYTSASLWCWFEYKKCGKIWWLWAMALFSGMAVLVKWLVGLVVFGVAGISEWIQSGKFTPPFQAWKRLVTVFSITLLVAGPWQYFIFVEYPHEAAFEMAFNARHFAEVLEEHGGDYLFHWNALRKLYGGGDLIPWLLVLGLIQLFRATRQKIHAWAFLVLVIGVYGFYTLAATKMVAFCLIAAPAFLIGLAALVDAFIHYLTLKIPNKMVLRGTSTGILLLISIGMFDPERVLHHHSMWKPHDNFGRIEEYRLLQAISQLNVLKLHPETLVITDINRVNGHIPVMYLSNFTAYPLETILLQPKALEHPIVLITNKVINSELKGIEHVIRY